MNLYLLRHAPAVERGTAGFADDRTRPLTPKGRRQLRKITQAMAQMDLNIGLVIASPLVRARQTGEIVSAELKLKRRLVFSNALAPGGEPELLVRQLSRLKPAPENILLVGHEPDLSRLAALWLTGKRQPFLTFKKSGLGQLNVEKLKCGQCATLGWLLTPKQLKRMI